MHLVEAVHGDLGMVVRGDVVLALSASGETEEILRLLATLKRLQVPLISLTCDTIYDSDQTKGGPDSGAVPRRPGETGVPGASGAPGWETPGPTRSPKLSTLAQA